MSKSISYSYEHRQTESTTGYFSCLPRPLPAPEDILGLMVERPFDTFLRRHALAVFAAIKPESVKKVFNAANAFDEAGRVIIATFLAELANIAPELAAATEDLLQTPEVKPDIGASPLGFIHQERLHAAWAAIFNSNIQGHRKLDSPENMAAKGIVEPFSAPLLERFAAEPVAKLPGIAGQCATEAHPDEGLMPAADVAELALERLKEAGALDGPEQRHMASLSPVGLLQPWRIDIFVSEGRNNHTLKGQANSYGRGLSLAQARASCRMEVVERFSAYVSIADGEVKNRAAHTPILRGRASELLERGRAVFDLYGQAYVEAPYMDQELLWVEGARARRAETQSHVTYEPVWVPLQMAALFCNCDEIDLCGAPGSTGIATGSTVEQARLAALTEVLERDSEATMLYHKKRCFQLDPASVKDETLAALLHDYRALGINLQFMDITGPLGLPCYQAFVVGPKGAIYRGHGASLSGPRALTSAITETPYPYPEGGPSGPMLRNLPVRGMGELPDYGTGSVKADLALLESLLCANGLNSVYVDLTHETLKFPVVRAIVPYMQPSADFDEFSSLSPRLYRDYLQLFS